MGEHFDPATFRSQIFNDLVSVYDVEYGRTPGSVAFRHLRASRDVLIRAAAAATRYSSSPGLSDRGRNARLANIARALAAAVEETARRYDNELRREAQEATAVAVERHARNRG